MVQDRYTRREPQLGATAEFPDGPDHGEATYRGTDRLAGRRAVITGGGSGIGRAVAIAFGREGADVLLSYPPEEEPDARETAQLVEKAGRRAVTVSGDIGDEDHCQALIDRAVGEFGGLDILVNNAAFQTAQPGGIERISTEQFDRIMRTNLYAMFWLCRAAVPHLGRGASIINTASVQAYRSSSALLDYATTKGGIEAFTRALAGDLATRGIRVNAVAPGPIWTPVIPTTLPPQRPEARAGQPAELAPAYVYFASPESNCTTGEVLGIAGCG
ncbi:SDR family oxidoreductase [Pseudosporangium ferrugineum]|uniref:NAD(P)-dependent dehydrogenase (Short-subunit alcohol dehydrogenase family) n=1 Tax=Pseudosporangium ferrugineum TaxID=439699 RepID=A0A2T0RFP7_9ACTN|nr:SDR family oxidoreductase [Pseudosporangium ferrugineum]PRY19993.1 NAD(P)-dependent dehydrogenase (short-subunit alcohol dehydrogenase family) [Pseudosporangium ferrugineum]